MHNRHHKERIAIIHKPRKRIIPRQKRTQQCKEAAGLLQLHVRHPLLVADHVGECEEEHGDVDEEEEGEEGEA